MAKGKKEKVEEIQEEIIETTNEETIVEEKVEEVVESEIPKIYIPDIPAQMIDSSIPEQPKGETEIDFLQRILSIQEEGGFGRHLNGIIYERIKSLS